MIAPYPLLWPVGYPRTAKPKSARFGLSLSAARDSLLIEIGRLGGTATVITSNALLLKNGLPASKQPRHLDDVGVAVYFLYQGKPMVLACDKWDTVGDNIRAIGLTVEAMRGMDRWGVSDLLDRAFAGFAALPPPSETPVPVNKPHWTTVLGVASGLTLEQITAAYKRKRRDAHPDAGGSNEAFVAVEAAYQQAKVDKAIA